MNALSIMQSPYWTVAGWTMLHFLWVGSLAALVVAVGRLSLRRAAPQVRYTYTLACFALLAASPAMIAVWVARDMPQEEAPLTLAYESDETASQTAWVPLETYPAFGDSLTPEITKYTRPEESPRPASLEPPEIKEVQQQGTQLAALAVALLPWLWIAGTPLTLAMLLAGFMGAERLRRQSNRLDQSELAFLCDGLCQSLAIARHVTVGVCDRVASPIVLGIVKPMILLPPAALAGWSAEQLEMVLLHELAHVRRWDNLVNLLQRLVESLLFFHPAVWVVSAWIRAEREHCCDAVVVAHTGRAEAYAETLASLAGASVTPWATATAMAERNLTARIRRLLNLEDQAMQVSFSKLGFVIGTCAAAVLIVRLYAQDPGGGEPGDVPAVSSDEAAVVDEEAALGDVAVDEEAASSDAVVEEDPAFFDEQPATAEASDAEARVRDLLRERRQHVLELREYQAELAKLKQQLAESAGQVPDSPFWPQDVDEVLRKLADGSSLRSDKAIEMLLREKEERIAVLLDALFAFSSDLENPEESAGYRFLKARLKHLGEQKKQLEQALMALGGSEAAQWQRERPAQQMHADPELEKIDQRIAAARERRDALEAGLKNPAENPSYQATQELLRELTVTKAQRTLELEPMTAERLEFLRRQRGEQERSTPELLELLRQRGYLSTKGQMEQMGMLNKARREEIERLKAAAEFMRQSLADKNVESAASSIRLAEEWLRKQIDKLEKTIEDPEDRRTSSLDAGELQFNRARELYKKADASFRKADDAASRFPSLQQRLPRRPPNPDDVVDPLAVPRHEPGDDDRGRLERLEREMQELKQMIRVLQEAVMSRATSAVPPGYIVPRPAVVPAQPIPGTWPNRPPSAGRQPQLAPALPVPAQQPTGQTIAPPIAVPPGAVPTPKPRLVEPTEPKPSPKPEPSEPPKPADEPAEPLDVPKEIEP